MNRKFIILSIMALLLTACEKEKKPLDAVISDYQISDLNQPSFILDTVIIDESVKTIYLLFANSIPSASFPLQFSATFNLTEGATSIPASGETVIINEKDERFHYSVTAKDGNKIDYFVVVRDNQLPDCGFEDWYVATGLNGKTFYEPGKSAETTVWATANQGTSTFGVYCTKPVATDGNTIVQIKTGETSLVPITAGTIYTGTFDVNGAINNPTDPKKATEFGIPFSLRPNSIKFRYSYQPGSRYIHAALKNPENIFGGFTVTDIAGSDMFTIYAVLERRDGNDVTEIARAELISGALKQVMEGVSLTFTYSSDEKPTHIYVVFASSKDGDLFTGAVGSTLNIDDVELMYQ
jgi:hypothetical protein